MLTKKGKSTNKRMMYLMNAHKFHRNFQAIKETTSITAAVNNVTKLSSVKKKNK